MTNVRTACLLAAAAALLVLIAVTHFSPAAVAAQPPPEWVVQPVVCTVPNGPETTVSVSASSGIMNSSSIPCDGTTTDLNITTAGSTEVTLTVSEPLPSPPAQYVFSGDVSSLDLTTCPSANTTCPAYPIENYYQVLLSVYYSVADGGFPGPPAFTCTTGGLPGYAELTTSPNSVWVDDGCEWSVSPNPLTGSGATERWQSGSQTSGIITGATTVDPVFFNQYDYSLAYSSTGESPSVAPSLSYTQFGSQASSSLTTSPQDYWLDADSTWSVSNPTPGSTSAERWVTPDIVSGTVASSQVLSFNYYDQFDIPFSYSVVGGGSGYSPPALTYTSLGNTGQAPLATTANQYWLDWGTSWSANTILGGSTASQQWITTAASGTVASPTSVALAYYHQYLVSTSFTVMGGGSGFTSPVLTYQSYGAQLSGPLSQGPYWEDSSGSWSVNNPLVGSTSQERWETNATTSGTILSPLTLDLLYFHQYQVSFGFSVLDGGSGYSLPVVTTSQFGSPVTEISGWADAGSRYSFTNPLNGSSSTQRWYTASGQGQITSASSISAAYYHQYDFVLSYGIVGSSNVPPPTLNSTTLGILSSVELQTAPGNYWLDSGSLWRATTLLPGSSNTERWMTNQVTSGMVTRSVKAVLAYFDQYAAGFTYSIRGGGSPELPSLNYTSFAVSMVYTLNSTRVVHWLDSRTAWSLTNPIYAPSETERWIAAKGTNGTADGPFNDAPLYTHQYLFTVKPNVPAGGLLEISSGWYNSASSKLLNATASSGWKFFKWSGEGTGSYTGSNVTGSVYFGSPINETAVFYAGLSLDSGNGGTVEYRYGQLNGTVQAGTNRTLYLAPGTSVNLTSIPSTVVNTFFGWSGKITGDAQNETMTVAAPTRVSAAFGVDYKDISTFYIISIMVMVSVAYIFIIRRRHSIFRSMELSTH